MNSKSPARPSIRFEIGDSCDFQQLVALSKSVYGFLPDGFSENYYRWQYGENPHGIAVIGNAVYGAELVGHYAILPIKVWLEGGERIVGLGVNALTRRDLQGHAIFARLAALVEKAALREGISSVYVVPSSLSKPWFLRVLGFYEWSVLPTWVRPLRLKPIACSLGQLGREARGIAAVGDAVLSPMLRLVYARRNPCSVEIKKVDEFDPAFETLWEKEKIRFHFSIARSCRHLRWRYSSVPTRQYQIWGAYSGSNLVCYAVARVRRFQQLPGLTVGVIADLFGGSDAAGRTGSRLLVARVLRWLYQNNVDLCMTQMASPLFRSALRVNGFFQAPAFLLERRALLFRSFGSEQAVAPPGVMLHFVGGDHDMG